MFQSIRLAAVALVILAPFAGDAATPDEEFLKKSALGFNDVTGEDQLDLAIDNWKKKPERVKALLKVALPLAQEKDQPFNYTGSLILGELAREVHDVDAGKVFYRISIDKAEKLKSDRKLTLAYLGLVDLLFENKKYTDAEKLCADFLERQGTRDLNIGKVQALRRMIQVIALQGKEDEAFKRLEPFVKAAPDDPVVVEIQGWLYRYVGKYDEALKAYEKLFKSVDNEAAKDMIRYQLSGLYTETGDIDKATEHLQELLKKNPNSPTFNNDLGYIWADNNRNLDEAEKMIKKALEREPKNPAYQDSMGWVLFKLKKFDDAKKHLEEAIKHPEGQHAEIYDHLGDVYLALKERDKALEVWKKAIDSSGTSKRDVKRKAEIEKKVFENR